jgi:ATP-dependent 26S proteasome regulatory subunit
MPDHKDPKQILAALLDPAIPFEHRAHFLIHLIHEEGDHGQQVVKMLFESAAKTNGEDIYAKKIKELSGLIEEMQNGPLRSGMFLEMVEGKKLPRRAKVLLQDGDTAFTTVPDAELAGSLRRGDLVLLEAQGRALLNRDPSGIEVGDEARLERTLDDHRVEIVLHDRESAVFWVSQALGDQLKAGKLEAGARLLVDPRRRIAFEAIPAPDGLANYWYLDRRSVPDVSVERDIGNPPEYIDELTEHIRTEMLQPELSRRYHLRRARTKLLTGVSGTGKTFSVYGFWRRMYEVISDVTGVPIEQLPPRILWMRMADIMSKWYGESEQRLSRYFNEVEQLASEKFVCPDGREVELPVLAIVEECDALARSRGSGEPITERVMTTALDRLDANSPRVKDKLIVYILTSNVPHMVDPAFLRRAGGTTEKFGRLGRRAFRAVLEKHLCGLPFRAAYGSQKQAERRVLSDVADWLYSRNGHDEGQVSLSYVGSTESDVRYRRDLLTAALVDRAVQQAATEACHAERLGTDEPGLSAEQLIESFDRQVRSVVEQLTRDNAHNYLDIQDGVRVADVRRLARRTVHALELERVR